MLEAIPLPAAVIAQHDQVVVRLEGWMEEVGAQARAANQVAVMAEDDPLSWRSPILPDAPVLVAGGGRLPHASSRSWMVSSGIERLLGVGYAWIACADQEELTSLHERADIARWHRPGGPR